MQITISALAIIAAAATVQASCVPLITCGMKRDVYNPHTPASVVEARTEGDDFGNAFAQCLNQDHAQITASGANSFSIKGANGNNFHDCDAIVNIYQKTGMTHGKLIKNADSSFVFTPVAADLPAWKSAVASHNGKSA